MTNMDIKCNFCKKNFKIEALPLYKHPNYISFSGPNIPNILIRNSHTYIEDGFEPGGMAILSICKDCYKKIENMIKE